jgi:RNA polymerase sigma-70 factor (ECF subfamily)
LLEKFIQASRTADRMQLMELFAEDVSFMGDGGGKVPSVLRMLRGAWRVLHLYQAIKNILKDRMEFRIAEINGAPGILRYVDGNLESTTSVVTNGAQILEIYVVRNPDKLRLIELRSI